MFSDDHPRTWSDMSFEFKGMFLYHIAMMAMFVAGQGLLFFEQIIVATAILLVIATASSFRRIRHKWRWPGVTTLRTARAVLTLALMAFFLFATAGGAVEAQGLSLTRPFALGPWVFAVLGIAIFSVLNVLNVTHLSERAFRDECSDQARQPKPAPPPEPRWKLVAKYVFAAAFLIVWLEGVTFFYVYTRTLRSASPVPTVEQSVALSERGKTVYVTPAEMRLIDQLRSFMFVAIPASIATAFFLQYVLKVRLSSLR